MGSRPWSIVACALVASCASAGSGLTTPPAPPTGSALVPPTDPPATAALGDGTTARLVLVGDVMLGRNVAPVVAGDPSTVFEGLRPVLVDADCALANLESPLTDRSHVRGEFALEADPASAELLAGAGFDVLGVANNHAADAGPETVLDTIETLESVGLRAVGGGAGTDEASAPLVLDVGGVRVGVVAYDLSGEERATTMTAGVNRWDLDLARSAVTDLRERVDVVVVGVHGGVEYLRRPDPVLAHVTGLLADWGADIVWGHGAHVAYPVEVRHGTARAAVVAPGLGNALFDQRLPGTDLGTALEVLVDRDGAIAMRTGRIDIDAGRSAFAGWDDPGGDAVALDGDWWTPVRPWEPVPPDPAPTDVPSQLPPGYVDVARSLGDITGTGAVDVVISYRRAASHEPVHDALPDVVWVDELGRSTHLAVYTAAGRMRWGAAFMLQPVGAIAVCDGSMALGFTRIDDEAVVAGGAWRWDGFGFRTSPILQGAATPTCADIDHDGHADPVLTARRPELDTTD